MITQVVSEVVVRNRARNGALEPIVGAYAGYLRHRGYASITIENYLQCAAHFGRWLTAQHIDLHHIDEPVLHRFLTVHLPVCRCCKPSPRTPANLRRTLRHLLRMLRSEGIVPPKSMLISEVVSRQDKTGNGGSTEVWAETIRWIPEGSTPSRQSLTSSREASFACECGNALLEA
ncbi:hypothetical protein [Paraburkholderia elongata]|uniref:Core-binding (CB) domain-containing protein n=1 Tax=Paraburkholderia elongata TaxID=2675747 RepID=A0A972NNR2_9BURK|nr:hypothetical protein [Paraburkholderia elongata]NPT56951.1 hypothetical protein [Paraburkholderia elongata]